MSDVSNVYNVVGAFQSIEADLIASMQRNMKRHIGKEFEEEINWTQWQAEMLKGLQEYRLDNKDKLDGYYSKINQKIDETIRQAYATGESEQEISILKALKNGFKPSKTPDGTNMQGAFFKVNSRRLNALIDATAKDFGSAEKSILRYTDDAYRKIIFKTQVYYNSGATTLYKAVDMASKDFLSAGINCIEYKNGARVNIASYAEMALRTSSKKATFLGEASKRAEYGIKTVKISAHYSACPLCVQWQGMVYYDDVYGDTSGIKDKKYPLLSTAINGGMFHPNCKNGLSSYYDGISRPPEKADKEKKAEMDRRYNLEQEQRKCERNIRKYKRLENGSIDPDDIKFYGDKRRQWTSRYNNLIKENDDILRKEPERLKLYGIDKLEKSTKIKTNTPTRDYEGRFAKGIGTKHYDEVHNIVDKSDNENLKGVWNKFESEIKVGNATHKGGAYCSGTSLYIDINQCAKGSSFDKPYQVLFHETGHGIDSAALNLAKDKTVWNAHFSSAYKDGLFPNTIKEEVASLVSKRDKELKDAFKKHKGDLQWFIDNGFVNDSNRFLYETDTPTYTKKYAYSSIKNEIKKYNSYSRADLSDILEGATGAKIQCGYGHGKNYWVKRTNNGVADGLATEAFAEMTDSTLANPESLELIKKYLPQSYKVYEEMLEAILNG